MTTPKIPCPHCGEQNYPSSPACWACGASLKEPRPSEAAPVEPTDAPLGDLDAALGLPVEQIIPPAEEPAQEPPVALPSPTAPAEAVPPIETPSTGPKPAEIEAASLQEKAYVTPPVDVDEGPKSAGEWLAYPFHWLAFQGAAFREALDEYDRRRGRKSGNFSSFSCLLVAAVFIIFVLVFIVITSHFAARR